MSAAPPPAAEPDCTLLLTADRFRRVLLEVLPDAAERRRVLQALLAAEPPAASARPAPPLTPWGEAGGYVTRGRE